MAGQLYMYYPGTASIGIAKLKDCSIFLVESGSTLKVCGEANELPMQRTVLALCPRVKSTEDQIFDTFGFSVHRLLVLG